MSWEQPGQRGSPCLVGTTPGQRPRLRLGSEDSGAACGARHPASLPRALRGAWWCPRGKVPILLDQVSTQKPMSLGAHASMGPGRLSRIKPVPLSWGHRGGLQTTDRHSCVSASQAPVKSSVHCTSWFWSSYPHGGPHTISTQPPSGSQCLLVCFPPTHSFAAVAVRDESIYK